MNKHFPNTDDGKFIVLNHIKWYPQVAMCSRQKQVLQNMILHLLIWTCYPQVDHRLPGWTQPVNECSVRHGHSTERALLKVFSDLIDAMNSGFCLYVIRHLVWYHQSWYLTMADVHVLQNCGNVAAMVLTSRIKHSQCSCQMIWRYYENSPLVSHRVWF